MKTIAVTQQFFERGLGHTGKWQVVITWKEGDTGAEHSVQLSGPARDVTQARQFIRSFTQLALRHYR